MPVGLFLGFCGVARVRFLTRRVLRTGLIENLLEHLARSLRRRPEQQVFQSLDRAPLFLQFLGQKHQRLDHGVELTM